MPLDAILLTALRRELENSLLGAKIDRISMPNPLPKVSPASGKAA